MGLFSKKPPCPICGGKISWLLPSKIEGEYICDTCYNKIDMDNDRKNQLTMQDFKEYLTFYDQNKLLRDQFEITERIDFGLWDTKIIFDYKNKLFCMSKNPDKTVFEGKHLKSFIITEDNSSLIEGSAMGILRYSSTVPERVMALEPQITQFRLNMQLTRTMDRLDDGKVNRTQVPYFDLPEPFQSFNVELHFDHPYWTVIKCDMEGPRFSNDHPDVNDYIRSYQSNIEEIEKLVAALKAVAFPDAPEKSIALGAMVEQIFYAGNSAPMDTAEEIRKYKAFLNRKQSLESLEC